MITISDMIETYYKDREELAILKASDNSKLNYAADHCEDSNVKLSEIEGLEGENLSSIEIMLRLCMEKNNVGY
jgi:hypothetical protein